MARLKQPETVAAAAARYIRDAIVAGEYKPGTQLPEVWLAGELGAARGTIREALLQLGEMGLVEMVPRRGTFVSQVTRRKARELYELRAGLEGLAVWLAIEHGDLGPDSRVALEARLAAMAAARRDDPMAFVEAERALHREIWARCGNPQLIGFLTSTQLQTRRLLLYNRAFAGNLTDEVEMHRTLIEEVVVGDADSAERAVRRHVRASGNRVLRQMPDPTEPHPEGSRPATDDALPPLGLTSVEA